MYCEGVTKNKELTMELSNIQRQNGKIKSAKRVGRGCGSGKGMHTTGRGNKGQLARTGSNPLWVMKVGRSLCTRDFHI